MRVFAEQEMRSSVFSPCRQYRYHLSQIWDEAKPPLLWLMLNPSTADEVQNDPTVERCERRARMWGYGGSEVYNIFGFRATDPKNMRAQVDPTGPENDIWMRQFAERSKILDGIVGWGAHGQFLDRGAAVCHIISETGGRVQALKINKTGHPAHPLYISYATTPKPYPLDLL